MSFRYLVIEDAGFIRELIKGICNSVGGVCVGESEIGTEGLELVRQTLPDIVILDLVLPGQNGVMVAAEIRKVWPDAKIVACTSLTDEKIYKKAKENGVDIIVNKPFTVDSLSLAINDIITKRSEAAT